MQTVCYACGATGTNPLTARCGCGEPRWISSTAADFDWNSVVNNPGLWRYRSLLPSGSFGGISDAAGGTPLLRAPELDDDLGARVHLKHEGSHPTGTFKDRGTAVGIAYAKREGIEAVATVSHGNMARSVAAHATAVDLSCTVLVPDDIPDERLAPIAQFDPRILRVKGDYGRLYYAALDAGRQRDVAVLNSDVPLRIAGQKTVALEICESLAPDGPDAVVLPASSGGNASAIWKGFRELLAADVLEELPRLYLTQTAACSPIVDAFDAGFDRVDPVSNADDTVAYSIANADPPSGSRALAAVRATGGAAVAVPDASILEAQRTLAHRAGIAVEPSSATVLAGARRFAAQDAFHPDESVVLVATGRGTVDSTRTTSQAVETIGMDSLGANLAVS